MTEKLIVPLIGIISNATDGILSESSPTSDFVLSVSNYLRAINDLELSNPQFDQGILLSKEAAFDIANRYTFIGADNDTGQLAILATQQLAAQGAIEVFIDKGVVNFSAGLINKTSSYKNYGKQDAPLAVQTDFGLNINVPSLSTIPVIANQEEIDDPIQLIAQTVIINAQFNQQLPELSNTSSATPAGVVSKETLPFRDNNEFDVRVTSTGQVETPSVQQQLAARDIKNQDIRFDSNATQSLTAFSRLTSGFTEDRGSLDPNNLINAARYDQLSSAVNQDVQSIVSGAGNTADVSIPSISRNTVASPNTAAAAQAQYTSAQNETTTTISSSNGINQQVTVPATEIQNPLHDYTNYTYKFTLYAISAEQANKIAAGSVTPANPETIITGGASQVIKLLSSGGSSQKTSPFDVDFFIDNVNILTVVGAGARTRTNDIVEMNFDIIEPYTVTFLPRLFDAAGRLCKGRQDPKYLFFVLKLEFLGYTDAGEPTTIPKTTKYFPFSMINLEFDVDNKGAVYKVKGVPINYTASSPLDNTIPFHVEISGQTLEELFNGTKKITAPDELDFLTTEPTSVVVNRGLATALDENEDFFVNQKIKKLPNRYFFRFEDGIGSKKINDPKTWTANQFRYSNAKDLAELTPTGIQLDKDKNTFRMQAGSKITDVINNTLQISDYYREQYDQSNPTPDKDLLLHKIIPEVKFGEIDEKTNQYQRDITYVIIPYRGGKNDNKNFGQRPPIATLKKYNWIFTGQNKDILSVKINYKMSFFDLRSGTKKSQTENELGNTTATAENQGSGSNKRFDSLTHIVNSIADQQNSGDTSSDIVNLSIQELFAKQFDTAGDLIKLDIEIIGDPDLLQQDYLLYGAYGPKGQLIYDSGSANFSRFEQYFQFNFKTPMTDYNESTGLFGTAAYPDNVFDGIYQIIQVKSEFRSGKFTQKLENARVRNQTAVNSSGTTADNATRPAATATATSPVAEPSTGRIDVISGATIQGSTAGTVGASTEGPGQIGAF